MQAIEKLFFALLQNEVCDSPLPSELPSLSGEDLRKLFTLADRQDLAHLLYDALTRNGLLKEEDPIYKSFSKAQMLAVLRTEEQAREFARVKELFDGEKIAFLPLKGAVLRKLYPTPWMRTSADLDLLLQKEDIDRAERLFVERGYELYFRTPHDVSYTGKTGVHIELHKTLSAKDDEGDLYSPLLADAWAHLTFDGEKPTMPDDLFYFYHLFHMAVHFKIGGCGVRPFLDLWLLNHRLPENREARDARLASEGLLDFAKNVEKLSEVWFSSAEGDEFTEVFSSFILSGGVYGSRENAAFLEEGKAGGKGRYRLHKIFLPYRELKERYPVLKKHPILFPFVSVFRWIRALLPKSKKATKKTLAGGADTGEKLGIPAESFWQQVGLP